MRVRLKTPFCLQCQIKLEFTLSVKKPWGKPKKSTKLKQKKQKKQKIYIYIMGGKRQINYKFISHKDPSVENCVVHMWKITGTPKFKLLQPSLFIISYTLTPSGKRA